MSLNKAYSNAISLEDARVLVHLKIVKCKLPKYNVIDVKICDNNICPNLLVNLLLTFQIHSVKSLAT